MILHGYGIRLIRLSEAHIELVRRNRNAEHVRNFMDFQDEITAEMQLEWFRSIDNIHNNYMLIEVDSKLIGLINGAGINWEEGITESGGIFIWDKSFWASSVPAAAALLLTDTSVFLGLKKTRAKVMKDNAKARMFNKRLGYKLKQESERYDTYELDIDDYVKNRAELRKGFQLSEYMPLLIEIISPDHPVVKFLEPKIERAVELYPNELILKGK